MTFAEAATNAQEALDALAAGDLGKARRLLRAITKAAAEGSESPEELRQRVRDDAHRAARQRLDATNAATLARFEAQRPAAPLASSVRATGWGRRRL